MLLDKNMGVPVTEINFAAPYYGMSKEPSP